MTHFAHFQTFPKIPEKSQKSKKSQKFQPRNNIPKSESTVGHFRHRHWQKKHLEMKNEGIDKSFMTPGVSSLSG